MSAKFWKDLSLPPNLLTLSRVLLVPVFVRMMLAGRPRAAFLVFLLAGLTDVLDGLAARLWHQKSRLGLWLDPVADKLLLTSAFVLLGLVRVSRPNAIPFAVVAIVIGRDVMIAIGALILFWWKGQKAFFPTLLGKVSTVAQVLTVLAVLVSNVAGKTPSILSWIYDVTLVATVASGVQYFIMSLPLFGSRKRS
ncbi:MAG TPA: CDP-alcohol phosphatidyltransferase family protein [Acidobacteriota bacterium]|nr:CDP-alcohol phosphatidyltransferase family protein [Acidobacteriota bacterium]